MNYQKIYNDLVEKRKTTLLEKPYDGHHIIPRCLGGDNSPENIVRLTCREHIIAHMLLLKINPTNRKLFNAVWMMTNMRRTGSRQCARLRELFVTIPISYETRKKLSDHAKTQIGRKQTPNTIAKRVSKNTGQKRSPEQCEKISLGNLGTVFTDEWRENLSKSHKGVPWTEERRLARKGKQIPWNKGITGYSTSKKGQHLTEESILKRTETRRRNNEGKQQ